jgi:urease accessory protein
MRQQFVRLISVAAAMTCLIPAAFAHHVDDGMMPTTMLQGVLSGIAHPVLGLDHLAFVVAIGIAAALLNRGWRVAVAFVGAAVVGALLHVVRLTLPLSEFLVALSLVIAGAALVASRVDHPRLWISLTGVAGLVHGYALAGSIIGATPTVTAAFVVGLMAGLVLIIVPIWALAHWLIDDELDILLPVRAAGGAVAALGVFFAASALIGS